MRPPRSAANRAQDARVLHPAVRVRIVASTITMPWTRADEAIGGGRRRHILHFSRWLDVATHADSGLRWRGRRGRQQPAIIPPANPPSAEGFSKAVSMVAASAESLPEPPQARQTRLHWCPRSGLGAYAAAGAAGGGRRRWGCRRNERHHRRRCRQHVGRHQRNDDQRSNSDGGR